MASTSATLRAVPAGDHALTVALATDDKTIVATDGAGIGVGPQPGDIPSMALDTTCGWQTLDGGGDTWYKIPYLQGTQLEITLDDYGAGIGFEVWDPRSSQDLGDHLTRLCRWETVRQIQRAWSRSDLGRASGGQRNLFRSFDQ